jgi:hypothetical protein
MSIMGLETIKEYGSGRNLVAKLYFPQNILATVELYANIFYIALLHRLAT